MNTKKSMRINFFYVYTLCMYITNYLLFYYYSGFPRAPYEAMVMFSNYAHRNSVRIKSNHAQRYLS